jgi:hypothetical protein
MSEPQTNEAPPRPARRWPRVLRAVLFLWLPLAALVLFMLAHTAFCAFPLSWVGDFFDNQPQYRPGEQGAFDIGLLLACYLVTYGLLSCWRGCWPWLKVTAGVCVALVAGGVVFAAQFGEAISGRGGDTPLLLWPFIAYEKLAYPATSGLREGHYLRHLGDADERSRSIAANGLRFIVDERRQGNQPIPPTLRLGLASCLRNANRSTRWECAEVLALVEPYDDKVTQRILEALADRAPMVRIDTADFLAGRTGQDERLTSALLAALNHDESRAVRARAAVALYRSKRDDSRLAPALARSVERGDAIAAMLLSTIAPANAGVSAAFAAFLAASEADVRLDWIEALEPRNSSVLRRAEQDNLRMRDQDDELLASLQAIEPRRIADLQGALKHRLEDTDAEVRQAAAYQLARLYPRAPEVRALLSESDRDLREQALRGLCQCGTGDSAIPPALARALLDRDETLRHLAARRLAELGPTDEQVQLAMVRALSNEARSCAEVGRGLLGSRTEHRQVVAAIVELLDHDRPETRACGVRLLGALRTANADAQVALAAALADQGKPAMSDITVGQRAAVALAACQPLGTKARAALAEAAARGNASATRLLKDSSTGRWSAEDFLDDRDLDLSRGPEEEDEEK